MSLSVTLVVLPYLTAELDGFSTFVSAAKNLPESSPLKASTFALNAFTSFVRPSMEFLQYNI